jgi:hypothetical protein
LPSVAALPEAFRGALLKAASLAASLVLVTTKPEKLRPTNLEGAVVEFDLQRTAQHEYEFPITEDKLDKLDTAIELCIRTPCVTKLTLTCSPKFAVEHKELLWSKGFQFSGSRTKDVQITLTFALIVKRSQDGGAGPLTFPKSAYEQQAIAEQVQRCDATLSKFGAR